MKVFKFSLAVLALLQTVCGAASISIDIQSGAKSLRDQLGVVLSGGNPALNGDGTRVRLGYYSGALQATPFGLGGTDAVADFIALTGPGTPFGISFTIGDAVSNTTGNGELFLDAFSINTGVADGLLPAAGTPLVVRFFNASQAFVLDLSNSAGLWNWKTPATPPALLSINFDDAGLVSRANGTNNRTPQVVSPATTNLQTTNPVPEPTSVTLLALGLVSLAARRRRVA